MPQIESTDRINGFSNTYTYGMCSGGKEGEKKKEDLYLEEETLLIFCLTNDVNTFLGSFFHCNLTTSHMISFLFGVLCVYIIKWYTFNQSCGSRSCHSR